jgi:hypothetical protein
MTIDIVVLVHFVFFPEIKNPQEQIVHLQHIVQLLPLINRDTLYVLLQFLGLVAENSEDKTSDTGKYTTTTTTTNTTTTNTTMQGVW